MVMLVMTLGTYQWPRLAGPFHFRVAIASGAKTALCSASYIQLMLSPSCPLVVRFPKTSLTSISNFDYSSLGFTTTVQVVPAASKKPSGTSSM